MERPGHVIFHCNLSSWYAMPLNHIKLRWEFMDAKHIYKYCSIHFPAFTPAT